jgi:hypothetical protein
MVFLKQLQINIISNILIKLEDACLYDITWFCYMFVTLCKTAMA